MVTFEPESMVVLWSNHSNETFSSVLSCFLKVKLVYANV